jgi:thiol:disulfide interchange protein
MSRRSLSILLAIIIIGVIAIGFGTSKPQNATKVQLNKAAVINKPLVLSDFTSIKGQSISLANYRGKRLMVYLVATWCTSCKASVQTLLSNATTLQKDGLYVVTLKTYGNAGYPGPSIQQFLSSINSTNSLPNNLIFGDASQALTASYNPNNTPDIYYLINPSGVVKDINSTPSATMNTILKFAQGS